MTLQQGADMCRDQAEGVRTTNEHLRDYPNQWRKIKRDADEWLTLAAYLEALGPRMERRREALTYLLDECIACLTHDDLPELKQGIYHGSWSKAEAALAAHTHDEIAEWQEIREKAELLDWCMLSSKVNQFTNWLNAYIGWDGKGDFLEALRAAKKEEGNASK